MHQLWSGIQTGMTDIKIPTHGEERGPCAICGKIAYPKFGHFLCTRHGEVKYAKKADEMLPDNG